MRIPSGSTDRVLYFVAVDSGDLTTFETGLSGFTVYRSRNGGAAALYTTPTIAEVSAGNMPGLYALTIDEDTTIGATHDTEEYVVRITVAGMAPVTRIVELYRPKATEGRTLTLGATGVAEANVASMSAAGLADMFEVDSGMIFGGAIPGSVVKEIADNAGGNGASGYLLAGVADSGTTTTLVDAALTQADVDYWKGAIVTFTSGTVSGQSRLITAFDPDTDTLTFTPPTTQAVSTNGYEIHRHGRVDVELWDGTAVNPLVDGRVDSSVITGEPTAVDVTDVVLVQLGQTVELPFVVQTDPAVTGVPGSFTLREMVLIVGSVPADVHDLEDDGFVVPQFVEQAAAVVGGASTSVTGDPVYAAAGGPAMENVYAIPVADSSGFTVGDRVRAANAPTAQAHVYRVLQIPSGVSILVHANEDDFSVEDGYTLEEVEPTGMYVGIIQLPVSDYISLTKQLGTFKLVVASVDVGAGPKWSEATILAWTRTLELDLAGNGVVVG